MKATRRQDIQRFYTLVETADGQILMNTLADARALARSQLTAHAVAQALLASTVTDADPLAPYIWFVREGGRRDYDVELWRGQFVNTLGFFVTKEPCRPGHQDRLFKY